MGYHSRNSILPCGTNLVRSRVRLETAIPGFVRICVRTFTSVPDRRSSLGFLHPLAHAQRTITTPTWSPSLRHISSTVRYNPGQRAPREGAAHADLLDEEEEEEEFWEDEGERVVAGSSDKSQGAHKGPPGKLAKMVWKAAVNNIRDDRLWKKLVDRVILNTIVFNPEDIVLLMYSFARIGYRDVKTFDALSPIVLKHIPYYSARGITLLLAAHKKLDYRRGDTIELLIQQLLLRSHEWEARDVAMACNAVSYFHVYQKRFWRKVSASLPKLCWGLTPQGIMMIVAGMNRVDWREAKTLLMLTRLTTRDVHLFGPVEVAATMNAFAKLDFNHPNLQRQSVERVRQLNAEDAFDLQAKGLLIHVLVCFQWTNDVDLIRSIMDGIVRDKDRLTPFHKRKLKPVARLISHHFPNLDEGGELALFLDQLRTQPVELEPKESRWGAEVAKLLNKMDIRIEKKPLVHEQQLDYVVDDKQIITCLGPYSYYAGTTHRTATSKAHQRVLEASGYTVIGIPHFEWNEIRTEEDKMLYLWTIGRRVAKGERVLSAEPSTDVLEEKEEGGF